MNFNNQNVLVTGGTGYIGSHTVVQLLEAGAQVIILDNLCNSKREVIDRIEKITGCRPEFLLGDICDRAFLRSIFNRFRIDSVIHFAGLKAIGESIEKPLQYYENNVGGSLILFEEMARVGVNKLIFSSSATVYGDPASVPISENFPLKATNPYGQSKLMVEDILRDLYKSDSSWCIALLRYFNPVGAHVSGLTGEDPRAIPSNLMPFIAQVAAGRYPKLFIFGGDYQTIDGTGVRDYIHVDDLGGGHLAALNILQEPKFLTLNLGTGQGYSVLDVVRAFEKISSRSVPYEIVDRRKGDVATCYADTSYARRVLGWKAKHGLERMCEDLWRWQSFISHDDIIAHSKRD